MRGLLRAGTALLQQGLQGLDQSLPPGGFCFQYFDLQEDAQGEEEEPLGDEEVVEVKSDKHPQTLTSDCMCVYSLMSGLY